MLNPYTLYRPELGFTAVLWIKIHLIEDPGFWPNCLIATQTKKCLLKTSFLTNKKIKAWRYFYSVGSLFPSNLSYFYLWGSEFGIRIRIHKVAEYGSNMDLDPQHCSSSHSWPIFSLDKKRWKRRINRVQFCSLEKVRHVEGIVHHFRQIFFATCLKF